MGASPPLHGPCFTPRNGHCFTPRHGHCFTPRNVEATPRTLRVQALEMTTKQLQTGLQEMMMTFTNQGIQNSNAELRARLEAAEEALRQEKRHRRHMEKLQAAEAKETEEDAIQAACTHQ